MKFYVVVKGRKPGIYLTWQECKEQVDGYKGAKHQSFKTKAEAEAFYKNNMDGKLPKDKKYANEQLQKELQGEKKYKNIDLCLLCEKPFKQQLGKNYTRRNAPLCAECKKRQHGSGFRSMLKHVTNGSVGWLTANDLVWIKVNYKCGNVFKFAIENPNAVLMAKKHASSGFAEAELKKERKTDYTVNKNTEFPYLKKILGEDKIFISISGDKRNPTITYRCKRCNGDYKVHYSSLKKQKGHDCSALVSSGESIVKDYLNKIGEKYFTQRDTLKCINPDTGYVMPYDFEIADKKIIIEVQGEQHRKFIEWFHVDETGFEYQKQKDNYKKQFAEEQGYRVIELWYSDFETGKYKAILKNALRV